MLLHTLNNIDLIPALSPDGTICIINVPACLFHCATMPCSMFIAKCQLRNINFLRWYSNYAFHSCCLNLLEFLKIGFGCFWDTSLIRYKLLCVIPSVSTVILQILKLCKCSQGVFTKHFLVFCILLLIGRKVPSLFLVCVPYISVFRLLPAYPLRIGHI